MTIVLYELSGEYQRLAEVAPEPAAADAPDLEALTHDLEAIQDEVAVKVLALAKVVTSLDAEADLLEQHAREIMARVGSRRNRVEYLKRWMRLQMVGAGFDRLKDAYLSVWLQQSPPSIEVLDEQAVPAAFKRAVLRLPFDLVPTDLQPFLQHLDVDRTAILELTKRTGEVVDGVHVRTGEKHLRIR